MFTKTVVKHFAKTEQSHDTKTSFWNNKIWNRMVEDRAACNCSQCSLVTLDMPSTAPQSQMLILTFVEECLSVLPRALQGPSSFFSEFQFKLRMHLPMFHPEKWAYTTASNTRSRCWFPVHWWGQQHRPITAVLISLLPGPADRENWCSHAFVHYWL